MNQFHDILPGSSINEAYQVTEKEYRQLNRDLENLESRAIKNLVAEDDLGISVVNNLSQEITTVIQIPISCNGSLVDNQSNVVPTQQENDISVALVTLPALTMMDFKVSSDPIPSMTECPEPLVLENDLVKYTFDEWGHLLHAEDKELERSILQDGEMANKLVLYDDHPNDWDAWDVDIFYEQSAVTTLQAEQYKRCAHGPVRSGIYFRYRTLTSVIEQWVILAAHSRRLDFQTRVDWHEKHRMLRTAFPVNIQSTEATFDIQYGYVRRPTHRNTSWDWARFEVAGQRYADLSTSDYGVALLNDCKYGYKVLGNVLDLNLLRSPNYPDADADQGLHEFTYSLLPHAGRMIDSPVWLEAALLNQGVGVYPGQSRAGMELPCMLNSEGISLEVIKKAEKEECHIIRLVEIRGCESRGMLKLKPGCRLVHTNLLEWENGNAIEDTQELALSLKPFEIVTYKLYMINQ